MTEPRGRLGVGGDRQIGETGRCGHSSTRECGERGPVPPHAAHTGNVGRTRDGNVAARTPNLLNLGLHDLRKKDLGENTENTKHKGKNLIESKHLCSSNVLVEKIKKESHTLGNAIFAKHT